MRPALLACGVALASLLAPGTARAQPSPGDGAAGPEVPAESRSFWSVLAGEASGRRRIIGGQWALHPFEPQFPEADWTQGVGFTVSQYFLATFVNSYDRRSFIAGIERSWVRASFRPVEAGLGYRAGVVTGYDDRLVPWADEMPLLPFAGLLAWVDLGPLGLDLFYVYRAITFETALRF